MTLSLHLLLASAATAAAASLPVHPESTPAVPTVNFPLHFLYGGAKKIATRLIHPTSGDPVDIVFDQGSENFWVFGPDAISNWGCTALFCAGPCNVTVTPHYTPSPGAPSTPFTFFNSYGANSKFVTGAVAVNDTLTFGSESGLRSTIHDVQVAVVTYMQQRLGTNNGACIAGDFDLGIMGTAPFQRSAEWNTTGPHVRQSLLDRGVIKAPVQSMWFDEAPDAWNGTYTGNAVFGGIETSKFSGPLVRVPVKRSDGLGASVGYYVSQPTITVNGTALPADPTKLSTKVCLIDSGTTSEDLPVSDHDALLAALGLVSTASGKTAWPGTCDSIPRDLTVDYVFPAVAGQAQDSVTIKVPLRTYARDRADAVDGHCTLSLATGGCMLAAPFGTAAFFAADDAKGEVALAQGGVSKRGSKPNDAAMSLTIP